MLPGQLLQGKEALKMIKESKYQVVFQALEGLIVSESSSTSYSPGSLYNSQNADEQQLLSWLQMAWDIKMNTSILKIYLLYADVKESLK